jgi:hypothetical protein
MHDTLEQIDQGVASREVHNLLKGLKEMFSPLSFNHR